MAYRSIKIDTFLKIQGYQVSLIHKILKIYPLQSKSSYNINFLNIISFLSNLKFFEIVEVKNCIYWSKTIETLWKVHFIFTSVLLLSLFLKMYNE